jgi:hypothetical protein
LIQYSVFILPIELYLTVIVDKISGFYWTTVTDHRAGHPRGAYEWIGAGWSWMISSDGFISGG